MTPKAKEYEEAGYSVVQHEHERNGVAGNDGYYVYRVQNGQEEPFFLAEFDGFYARAISREEAVSSLYQKIIASTKQN